MPYDIKLEQRLDSIAELRDDIHKQKMFGGVGYLLRGNMCFGIWKDCLILRLGEPAALVALKQKNVKPFDITGRAMKGWVMVLPIGIKKSTDLQQWTNRAVEFVIQLPRK